MNITKKKTIDVFDDDIKPGMAFKLTPRGTVMGENIIVMRLSSDRTYFEYVRIVMRNSDHFIDTCCVYASAINSGDIVLTPLVPELN